MFHAIEFSDTNSFFTMHIGQLCGKFSPHKSVAKYEQSKRSIFGLA
jgi:hypothetical protein